MNKELIIRSNSSIVDFALLKDGKLVEHSAMAPDRDFQELEEALEKVKNFING